MQFTEQTWSYRQKDWLASFTIIWCRSQAGGLTRARAMPRTKAQSFSHGSPSPHSSQIANHSSTISTNGRFCAKVVSKQTPGCPSARYYYHGFETGEAVLTTLHFIRISVPFYEFKFFAKQICTFNQIYVNRMNDIDIEYWCAILDPQASNLKLQTPSNASALPSTWTSWGKAYPPSRSLQDKHTSSHSNLAWWKFPMKLNKLTNARSPQTTI